MEKREIITGLRKAYQDARQRENLLKSYRSKKNEIEQDRAMLQFFPPKSRIKSAIIPIIVFVVGMEVVQYSLMAQGVRGPHEAPVIFWGTALILGAWVAYALITAPKKYFNSKAYLEEMEELMQMEKQLDATIGQEVRKLYANKTASFPQLAERYHTPQALQRMLSYFEDDRVDTIREAIDKYEEDCHRQRLEDAATETAEENAWLRGQLQKMEDEAYRLSDEVNYLKFYK